MEPLQSLRGRNNNPTGWILTVNKGKIAQLVKNRPAMKEILVWFLGGEDTLEMGQATHSSIIGFPLWLSW